MINIQHLRELGSAMRQLRKAARFTQAEICERTGLRTPQLSRWENGREVPTLESLVKYLHALGVGLVDLERVLLGEEDEERDSALNEELRRIRAGHQRRIESSSELQLAVREILRSNPEGLERRVCWRRKSVKTIDPKANRIATDDVKSAVEDFTAAVEAIQAAAEATEAAPGETAPAAAEAKSRLRSELDDPELEALLDGLPETLEQVLAHPGRHQPAVVEWLLDRADELLAEYRGGVATVVAAARRLADELPASWPRDRSFRLRARSLDFWATLQRAVARQPENAEAAWLSAFELLCQVERPEPPDLAVVLGRCALLASDFERDEDLARYASQAARICRAADREWPLPTFLHLWETVLGDHKTKESAVRLAKALFRAIWEAWSGFEDQPWEMSLEIVYLGKSCEIRLERKGPASFLPDWQMDEAVVHSLGKKRTARADGTTSG